MGNFTGRHVQARKSFGYGGQLRYIGEVFELTGMRNDDKLWGLRWDERSQTNKLKPGRYTEPFDGNPSKLPKCSECGAAFINHAMLEVHGDREHKGR